MWLYGNVEYSEVVSGDLWVEFARVILNIGFVRFEEDTKFFIDTS